MRWIEEGAGYAKHWAFSAPQKHPAPAVKEAAWAKDEIDRFILAKVDAAAKPAAKAAAPKAAAKPAAKAKAEPKKAAAAKAATEKKAAAPKKAAAAPKKDKSAK